MSAHATYVRDLALMSAAAVVAFVATLLFGPVVGLLVFMLELAVGTIVGLVATFRRALDDVDAHCAAIDEQLDQERTAREMLRVQRTVHAEPQAPVVDINTRRPVA